ncbi:MAG: decaprenyl-phosphate phosphoribosyltransferase [Anaerolineae bacterium]|nr:decaprenyl-phosphate phosphoribosyltransferase [Anaerolineae bacterium]
MQVEACVLKALLKTMRPKQWVKNVFIFAAVVFDKQLTDPVAVANTVLAVIAFCLVSSAVYLVNDLVDIEKDRQHPTKRKRPLPSGQLDRRVALAAAIAIPAVCIPTAFVLNLALGAILLAYYAMMLLYSFYLKHIVIVDVMTIAAGFVLRVAAGVVVIDVARFSPWLYVCMTLLALFLAVGRRRHELFTLGENANSHRSSLEHYSLELIDQMSLVVTSAAIMAYSLYTFSAPNLPRLDGQPLMMLTIPFVLYAIFRYQYLIHVRKAGGTPEDIVLGDLPFIVDLGLYGVSVLVLMYLF